MLEALVAAMSTGPVQVADGVGFSDARLIARACAADGLLLKPSRAMTAMDFSLVAEAFKETEARYPARSEIWVGRALPRALPRRARRALPS